MVHFWRDDSAKAVILGTLSGVFVANTNLCVKLSSQQMETFQILVIISIGNLFIASCISIYRKKNLCFQSKDAPYLIARSLAMTAARMFYYIAIARLPVFDAETIKNTRSVFTIFLLVITCQEKIGLVEIVATLVTFTGVVCVCKPPMIFDSSYTLDTVGCITGLLSATCHAAGYLLTKKIPEVHFTVMNFYEFLLHAIGSAILIFALGERTFPTNYTPYITTAVATVSLFTTTALQILALSYGSAAIVAITINVNVPALFILQIIVQDKVPTYLTIIGAILVLAGVFIISFRQKINDRINSRSCCKNNSSYENIDDCFREKELLCQQESK